MMRRQTSSILAARKFTCQTCECRKRTEWCALSEYETLELDAAKVINHYRSGQTIFFQGNPCMGLYAVAEGTVALRRTDSHGRSVIVRLVEAGQTLGYRAFFSSTSFYAASAEAVTDSLVCFISREKVAGLLKGNNKVVLNFLRRLADDLDGAEDFRLKFLKLPVRGRLAQVLLLLKHHHGRVLENGDLVIDLPMSRQDLADMIDSRAETLSRAVTALQKEGAAVFEGRRVLVHDLDSLFDEVESYE